MKMKSLSFTLIGIILLAVLITSCSGLGGVKTTPTVEEPTATAVPLKEITLCTAEEPKTLFYYGEQSKGAELVFDAIYDGPFDWVNYLAEPVIIEKVPSLGDGSASYVSGAVNASDLVVDVDGNISPLAEGVKLFPSGCQAMDCAITWDGVTPIQMDRLTLVYTLKQGVQWSDGETVKAADSQYAYQVAAGLENSRYEEIVDEIVTYETIDDRSVKVTTLPGLITSDYTQFFFSPLPQHALSSYTSGDLETVDAAAKLPLGWGPFKITAWNAGTGITLEKNEFYFWSAEGYPALDKINVKFLRTGQALNDLIAQDGCDVIDDSLIKADALSEINTLQNDRAVRVETLPGENWEVLLLGINPASYDDGYYPYGSDRPDLFSDVAVRNAIRQCIDHEAIAGQQVLIGNGHPFVYFPYDVQNGSATNVFDTYDPTAANTALDAAGWKDYDANPATPRVAYGVSNVPDGTVFSLNLYTTTSSENAQIAQGIQTSLANCGIQIKTVATPAAELYAKGPEGVLFGRKFDLALISWKIGDTLPCALFESEEIPSEDNYWIGVNDGGGNVTGYQNAAFDAFCTSARYGSTDQAAALNAQLEAAKLLDQETPFLSLFFDAKTFIVDSKLCFPDERNSEKYPYSSLEYWDFRDTCN